MKDIDNLANVINSDMMRKDIEDKKKEVSEAKESLLSTVIDPAKEKDFIDQKLAKFETVEQLKKHLAVKENVVDMFTNPITGEVLDVKVVNDKKEIDFRRDLLIYIKETDIQTQKIDAEYEKLDTATKEFQTDVDDACYQLADNVLVYIDGLKLRVEQCSNNLDKAKMMKSIKALESGFTLELYKETYTKYPSAVERCKSFITKEKEVADIGKRYLAKLKSAKTKVNLLQFASDLDNRKSFEEMVFTPDEYNTAPDMFVFSLIRHFSMANWNDISVVQGHATIALNMKKLLSNEIDEVVKERFKAAILDYLKIFE